MLFRRKAMPAPATYDGDRTVPGGIARAALLASLRDIRIDDTPTGALAPYVEQDLDRFLLTFNLSHLSAERVLEIGSNPYFLTILLQWFRPDWRLELVNFFGAKTEAARQHVVLGHAPRDDLATAFDMPYTSVDIEAEPIPFADQSFDLVYFCEVLEHFIVDPFGALLEIRRTLRTGGHLVLTTPNVGRLENIARLVAGQNLYDPYSGHGPHGRHNREYTRHEVAWLLDALGFEPVSHFTADVHPRHFPVDPNAFRLPPGREHDLGQYQFHLWRKTDRPIRGLRPAWLYRSMMAELDPTAL